MKHKNFFMVPKRVFDLELKPRDFAVYCCLIRHSDNKNSSCFPSRRVITKECTERPLTVQSKTWPISVLLKRFSDTVRMEQGQAIFTISPVF